MITAIEIENFKAFGKRQRIAFRPITLLCGPNSAGKSSILHAMLYADEILRRRNLDADRTVKGGEYVDLGGFASMVHNRDLGQSVKLKFEMDFSDRPWPNVASALTHRYDDLADLESAIVDASSGWVEIEVRYDEKTKAAYVADYAVGLDGEFLARFRNLGVTMVTRVLDVNTSHMLFQDLSDEESSRNYLDCVDWSVDESISVESGVRVELADALPRFDELPTITADDARLTDDDYGSTLNPYSLPYAMLRMLSYAMMTPGRILRDELGDRLRYIGPLRKKPRRRHQIERRDGSDGWATGLAAWDYLHQTTRGEVDSISEWLAGDAENRLNVGYEVRVRRYRELDEDSPLAVSLTTNRALEDMDDIREQILELPLRTEVYLFEVGTGLSVLPSDVGEGIAQILPIVVGVFARGAEYLAIEQPELHVHPRIQVAIGDLLIEWTVQWQRRTVEGKSIARGPLIVETHSEHILLRLLRRIRETHDGDLEPSVNPLYPKDVMIVYVDSGEPGAVCRELRIDATGEFMDRWPRGFFDERAGELF